MALSSDKKERIALEVIKVLSKKFEDFPSDGLANRNAPFHEAFLNAFSDHLDGMVPDIPMFVSLSSWLHGLSTSLGMTFFENVAHILSDGEKREYTSKKLGNLQIHRSQRENISQIIVDMSNSTRSPDLENENELIYITDETELTRAMDFSADVYIEDNNEIIAIELKSVKPNSGEIKGEKQKILEGKAALFQANPTKMIMFYIGFPFDPTVNPEQELKVSYNKERFLGSIINMNKYFAQNETLIASELWDKLSGEDQTMEQILDIINTIATRDFINIFSFIKDNNNRANVDQYIEKLNNWFLFSEKELVENDALIKEKLKTKSLENLYNNISFKNDGSYNQNRYFKLRKLWH